MEELTFGNPWFTQEIQDYLNEREIKNIISKEEKLRVILEHLELLIEEKGEYIAIREMRKYICWYIKNLKESSKVRQEINTLETRQEVINCLVEYFKTL